MSEFESYFSKIYEQRWPKLLDHLRQKEQQVYYPAFQIKSEIANFFTQLQSHLFNDPEVSLQRDPSGYIQNYILDPASLAPVLSLEIKPTDQVLDLCAAPGGKSLACLSHFPTPLSNSQAGGRLLSNDSSPARFNRLKKVLQQYSPASHQGSFQVTKKDGTKFGFYHSGEFDKALVDTPCSSERHLIHQNKTSTWSPKRSRYLSIKQYTLLCATLLCCKPGATIVYSTCSINPVENDDVIARLLKKKKDKVSLLTSPSILELGSEPTKYGQIILPDTKSFGPIYYAKLQVND